MPLRHVSWMVPLSILLLIASRPTAVDTLVLPSRLSKNTALQKRQRQQCSFEGDPDLYGLGIRLGIYIQWATSWLANNFIPEAIADNLDTNSIFLLAVGVAVLHSTVASTINALDAIMLLMLAFGYLLSVLFLIGFRTTHMDKVLDGVSFPTSTFCVNARVLLGASLSAFAIWFWFVGIDTMTSDGCAPYFFLFTKTSALGGARVFEQTLSVIALLYFGSWSTTSQCITLVTIGLWLLGTWNFVHRRLKTAENRPKAFREALRMIAPWSGFPVYTGPQFLILPCLIFTSQLWTLMNMPFSHLWGGKNHEPERRQARSRPVVFV